MGLKIQHVSIYNFREELITALLYDLPSLGQPSLGLVLPYDKVEIITKVELDIEVNS